MIDYDSPVSTTTSPYSSNLDYNLDYSKLKIGFSCDMRNLSDTEMELKEFLLLDVKW